MTDFAAPDRAATPSMVKPSQPASASSSHAASRIACSSTAPRRRVCLWTSLTVVGTAPSVAATLRTASPPVAATGMSCVGRVAPGSHLSRVSRRSAPGVTLSSDGPDDGRSPVGMQTSTDDLVAVPGAAVQMGNTRFYPEERPVVSVDVADVWWQPHPVTNAQFAAFVTATGHVSLAECPPDPEDFPDADPALLVPGSQVFTQPSGPVPLHDWTAWWRWQPGASWRSPQGPRSDWRDVPDHPVVHVGWEDAAAYATWARLDLPTEGEFEHAARGGLVDRDYAWGDELHPDGRLMANTWQG